MNEFFIFQILTFPFVTVLTWWMLYTGNGGTDKLLRALRRDIRMLVPGQTSKITRITWTKKQIKKLAKIEQEDVTLTFYRNGKPFRWTDVIKLGKYDDFVDEFCLSKKMIASFIIEALLVGIFWPLLLVAVAVMNICMFIKWLYEIGLEKLKTT